MWNCFSWFQTAAEPPTQARPGFTITLDASDVPDAKELVIEGPGGLQETVPIDPDTRQAVFGSTARPGLYRYHMGEKQGAFAVNVGDPNESDVRPRKGLLANAEVLDVETLSGIQVGGRRLWPILLWLSAILAVMEAVLYHRRIYF